MNNKYISICILFYIHNKLTFYSILLFLPSFRYQYQHAWDEPIFQFISCLEESGKEGPFWVCAFAIYQNSCDSDKPTIAEQLGPDPEFGPFATVLMDAESMIAVMTTLCEIYTRLWCVLSH